MPASRAKALLAVAPAALLGAAVAVAGSTAAEPTGWAQAARIADHKIRSRHSSACA